MTGFKKIISLFIVFACLSTGLYPIQIFADDTTATQAQLQQQLLDIQNQIAQFQQQLGQIQAQKNTLANKINELKKQQAVLNLQIKATNLKVNDLANQIASIKAAISKNQDHSKNLKEQMATERELQSTRKLAQEREEEVLKLMEVVETAKQRIVHHEVQIEKAFIAADKLRGIAPAFLRDEGSVEDIETDDFRLRREEGEFFLHRRGALF